MRVVTVIGKVNLKRDGEHHKKLSGIVHLSSVMTSGTTLSRVLCGVDSPQIL